MTKPAFLNLVVDHMAFLVEPRFYPVSYAIFRIIFGVPPEGVVYEKRRKWPGASEETSMTFAAKLGDYPPKGGANHTIMAVIQPSEPVDAPSHVRQILKNRGGSSHWQHIALRTPDLLAFHEHCLERGVNFITPIFKDEEEDLIQVFSGEWKLPGAAPSGIFFEFVQRDPRPEVLRKIEKRQAFFRDKTFLGLYGEKENEYQSGTVTPFIDDALFLKIEKLLAGKPVFKITDKDLEKVESAMLDHARPRLAAR